MSDERETSNSPKGHMSRRTALIVAGSAIFVIVAFFMIMSAITLSTTPTPEETPREGTSSQSVSPAP
ncbi:hypothetical protein [Kocuria marina]|uniref:hypothetical protein n=1 Tax=Kocuria marina TaxID=223184 RepID=UPI0022E68B83|nr:hypothetical protein [Kocuria marina]